MIQKVFNCEVCEPIMEEDIIHVIFPDKNDSAIGFDWSWWIMEYKEPTTKNDLGVDAVSRAEVLKLMQDNWHTHNGDWAMQESMDDIRALPPVTPQEPRWIPLTKRPMTDEEQEYYKEWADIEGAMIFDCPLPEDGQEVLVSYGDYVCVDTFCKYDGCYFEGVDIDDVDAWMPLPKPYEPQESEDV